MQIDRVELVPYALPFKETYITAKGGMKGRGLLLLRVGCAGQEGLGDAASLPFRGSQDQARIARDLNQSCRPLLEGAEVDPANPWSLYTACERAEVSRQALAAVELALLDLCGKLQGRPVWALLGAEDARPVPCCAPLSATRTRELGERALRWANQGYSTFKLNLGLGRDLKQVEAVREALGPEARIRVDPDGVWTTGEAVSRLQELEPFDIELVEEPAETLEDLAAVRQKTRTPVVADQSVVTIEDARNAVKIGACDAATVEIAKVGGIRAAREIAENLPVYLSSALDGPVGIAGAAHLAQVLNGSGFAAGLAHDLATAELFADSIAASASEVVDTAITPSDAPGLGVEIDERALQRLRF
jgi:L-alanine-DL-glutamate epimerase-like enolase superfamily enzyme